ncbi:hypothetical protein IMZ48_23955 [Candidatus Bathyarchaeota archaeon]|nr:hypothetical protein [Candidatus Bathyarchaeota archaeon]
MTLAKDGRVYAWGVGEQNQLGRRILGRRRDEAFKPTRVEVAKSKAAYIATGSYHSFAVDTKGDAYAVSFSSHPPSSCLVYVTNSSTSGALTPSARPDTQSRPAATTRWSPTPCASRASAARASSRSRAAASTRPPSLPTAGTLPGAASTAGSSASASPRCS